MKFIVTHLNTGRKFGVRANNHRQAIVHVISIYRKELLDGGNSAEESLPILKNYARQLLAVDESEKKCVGGSSVDATLIGF